MTNTSWWHDCWDALYVAALTTIILVSTVAVVYTGAWLCR